MVKNQVLTESSRQKRIDILGILLLLAAGLVIVRINFMVHLSTGDDAVNIDMMKHYGWLPWVWMRYMTWSGRISNELVGYIGLHLGNWFYWITNPLFVFLAAYSCARIITPKPSFRHVAFVLMAFGVMNMRTQTSTIYWISGSYGYIMPAAFAFLAMVPFADFFFRDTNKISCGRFLLTGFAALMATLGNEPVSLVATTFVLLCMAYKLIKKDRISAYFWILTILFVVGTVILFRSPGSALRWKDELRWFPGFDRLTLGAHVKISASFLFDAIINQQALLLLLVAAIPFFAFEKYSGVYQPIFYLYTILCAAFISTKLITGTHQVWLYDYKILYDFSYYRHNYYAAISLLHLLPYFFWALFFVCLIVLVAHVSDHPIFDILCFLAGGASLLLITFSPTIYASGSRILFVCSLMLAFVFIRFVFRSPLLFNHVFLCSFAVLAFLNVYSFAQEWLTKGYAPIL